MSQEITLPPAAGGVFRIHAPVPQRVLDAATGGHMQVAVVGLQGARDKNAFLAAVGEGLRFPEYFGHNWDAFYDCLADLAPATPAGILLLLRQASGFARAEPEEFAAAIDALRDAADFWRSQERMLVAIVELDAPVLAPELAEISFRPA